MADLGLIDLSRLDNADALALGIAFNLAVVAGPHPDSGIDIQWMKDRAELLNQLTALIQNGSGETES